MDQTLNKKKKIKISKNTLTKPTKNSLSDNYTENILKEQYLLHQTYVINRKKYSKLVGITIRLPSIPEDISENIIKFIIRNKMGKMSTWNCSTGDLYSHDEGKQECKCFTSNGPLSFTPTSHWDVIYFLDARKWLENKFVLYRIELTKTSDQWKNIMVNKKQSFHDQCLQCRRPRLVWSLIYSQLESYIQKIYEGDFDDIFIDTTIPTPVLSIETHLSDISSNVEQSVEQLE